MRLQFPVAITISRQLASGGSYLGQALARRLGFYYADREILHQAALALGDNEESLVSRDETAMRFWEAAVHSYIVGPPEAVYLPQPIRICSDRELFATETAIIEQLARTRNVIIVGHGGFHVLRHHPAHISIFLHADFSFRLRRVMELYHRCEKDARAMIEAADRERARYTHALSGKEWTDLRNYEFCLETNAAGLEESAQLLFEYINMRCDPAALARTDVLQI